MLPRSSRTPTRLAVSATFCDEALFDALTGRVVPVERLPFELPSSMEAVRAQASDAPHDSRAPLYPWGYVFRHPPR
jgi:hypothetical protein